eukprot:jgi/Mesen1/6668/ME000342S05760
MAGEEANDTRPGDSLQQKDGDAKSAEVSTSGSAGLRVNDSLSQGKVLFKPSRGNQVTWYICGPTVYDATHIGHARTYLSFDIIRRILEDYFGYEVFYVMNVTDVDDKIIKRARTNHLLAEYRRSATDAQQQVQQEELKLQQLQTSEAGLSDAATWLQEGPPEEAVRRILQKGGDALAAALDESHGHTVTDHAIFREHGRKYEKEYFDNMARLGVKPPHVVTRVTEYVPAIVAYVEKIVERGFAYALPPVGDGPAEERNSSVYFDTTAFQKAGHAYGKLCPHKVGSAALAAESEANFSNKEKRHPNDFALWKGRPGWHIECSAMASEIIGDIVDIHSGGVYLNYTARQIRLLFLLQAWDKRSEQPMEFGEKAMGNAISTDKLLKNFAQNVQVALREAGDEGEERWDEAEKRLHARLADAQLKVRERLEDNFDTRGAMDALCDLITAVQKRRPRALLLRACSSFITKILSVFGVEEESGAGGGGGASKEDVVAPVLDAFRDFRDEVRRSARQGGADLKATLTLALALTRRDETMLALSRRNVGCLYESHSVDGALPCAQETLLALTDRVRDDTMVELGVRFEDRPDGAPCVQVKELEKWEVAAVPPSEAMKQTKKYGAYDEQGVPSSDAEGKPLSGKAQKGAKKEFDKQAEAHKKYLEKVQEEPAFLESLRAEISALSDQLTSPR